MEISERDIPQMRKYPDPKYREELSVRYKDNFLIRALPDVPSWEEAYFALARAPEPREAGFRTHAVHRRLDLLGDLQKLFLPTRAHIIALQRVMTLIRDCYAYRDLNNPRVQAALHSAATGNSVGLSRLSPTGGGSNGLVLWGVTGAGKTSFVDRLCEFIENFVGGKVVYHKEVQGRPCLWPQIPIVRIQCKGTLKGTLQELLSQVDEMLGTQHRRNLGSRVNRDTHIVDVAQILSSHLVGLLIVEDVQKLKDSESTVLEYFCDLMEAGGFPVMLVGTYSFRRTLFSDASLLSKLTAQGIVDFPLIPLVQSQSPAQVASDNGDDWTPFIEELWSLNVFEREEEMPPWLPGIVHFHTFGVRRFAREMMSAIFVRCLNEEAVVSKDLVDSVAMIELGKYQDALTVLRKREMGQMITDADAKRFEHFLLPADAQNQLIQQIAHRERFGTEAPASDSARPGAKAEPKVVHSAGGKDRKSARKPAARRNPSARPSEAALSAEEVHAKLVAEGRVKPPPT